MFHPIAVNQNFIIGQIIEKEHYRLICVCSMCNHDLYKLDILTGIPVKALFNSSQCSYIVTFDNSHALEAHPKNGL